MKQNQPTVGDQASYWDKWNARSREVNLPTSSSRQGDLVEQAVAALGRNDLNILDVGCGTGWVCQRLERFGQVTGTDMTSTVLERARIRVPQVRFICGDFFKLDLPYEAYDVIVSLEVLSHIADQQVFIARLASLLKPGGLLLLSTQNRPVFERWDSVAPPDPAQIRHWVDRRALLRLLKPSFESIEVCSLVPAGNRGVLRFSNSVKLNRVVAAVFGYARVERWKELMMLGQTLLATARRRRNLDQAGSVGM
jgi:2-polyprenyl-3-methyl-5-hydroxy-6-metoxy-1,4-benzoquinol methylase